MAKPHPGRRFCSPYLQPDPAGPSTSRFGQLLPNGDAGAGFYLAYAFLPHRAGGLQHGLGKPYWYRLHRAVFVLVLRSLEITSSNRQLGPSFVALFQGALHLWEGLVFGGAWYTADSFQPGINHYAETRVGSRVSMGDRHSRL